MLGKKPSQRTAHFTFISALLGCDDVRVRGSKAFGVLLCFPHARWGSNPGPVDSRQAHYGSTTPPAAHWSVLAKHTSAAPAGPHWGILGKLSSTEPHPTGDV